MTQVQHAGLTHTLRALEQLERPDIPVRLRIGLIDGSVIDGRLESASAGHISLVLPNAQARFVPTEQIRSLHRAHRRPLRKLIVLALGIVAATTGVGLLYQVPALRDDFSKVVGIFLILGAALAMQVVNHTRLGDWLTSWETLFDSQGR